MKKILVFCIAQGIDKNIIQRFYDITKKSTNLPITVYTEEGDGKPNLLFNKSVLLNKVLKENISKYDIILQTDIDLLFPPGIIDYAVIQICNDKKKNTFYHSRLRRCQIEEIIDKDYSQFPWNEWKLRESIFCSGCWNMGPSSLWNSTGGYNENMFGWGGEDDVFYKRSKSVFGARWITFNHFPLVHVDHAKRTQKRSRENMSFANKDLNKNWLI